MENDFSVRIANIERRLLELKTASDYASVRSAYTTQVSVYTGLYRVTYSSTDEAVFSFAYGTPVSDNYGTIFPRTPNGNQQVIEVNTDMRAYPSTTQTAQMTIIANKPVVSITRIS